MERVPDSFLAAGMRARCEERSEPLPALLGHVLARAEDKRVFNMLEENEV
jgi:hypothetical protein